MSKSFLKDLPELIAANIISADKAKEIENYYNTKEEGSPNRMTVVLGILGALLAGSGIVLLIAHNWDGLSNIVKTVLAFIPLVIGQSLCLYSLSRKSDNVLWKECSAVFLFFAVIACIALISQIFHINGSLHEFLLTVLLLTVPLVYLMPSSSVSLLFIAFTTWYDSDIGYGYNSETPYSYFPLLLLIAPHYWQLLKKKNNFFYLHNWMLCVSAIVTFGTFGSDASTTIIWLFAGYMSLFCLFYFIGKSSTFSNTKVFLNPFVILGRIGIILILFIWSFLGIWEGILDIQGVAGFIRTAAGFLSLIFLLPCIRFLYNSWWKKEEGYSEPIGLSAFVFIFCTVVFARLPVLAIFIINAWIIFLAVYYIRLGSSKNHLGILNSGLLIIVLLAIFRFFDDKIPFVWRGLFFLAAGAGFFVANYLMIKKRKLIKQKANS